VVAAQAADMASEGLQVAGSPGLGTGPRESRWTGMPFVVFPGNVGEAEQVAEIIRTLSA
jgi:hypothetical protein